MFGLHSFYFRVIDKFEIFRWKQVWYIQGIVVISSDQTKEMLICDKKSLNEVVLN